MNSMNKEIKQLLANEILLFDGAMGTYYAACSEHAELFSATACLSEPELISKIHREYIAAGARAIKTNTFAANTNALNAPPERVREIIKQACVLAKEAAGEDAFIFGDISPIQGDNKNESEYLAAVDIFLESEISCFLLESFADNKNLRQISDYIKRKCPEAYILTSFAVQPDGFTASGLPAAALLAETASFPAVDAVGMNCLSGPALMKKLAEQLPDLGKPLSLMPNSGFPSVYKGRFVYPDNPAYFAVNMQQAAAHARIMGGCCGTAPEYITMLSPLIKNSPPVGRAVGKQTDNAAPTQSLPNKFWEKLESGKRVIAVELDPPQDNKIDSFISGARVLAHAGIDAITIADCPIARVHADSSILAIKLQRELGIDAIPHMTCRDRNLNATKALLFGLSIERIANVLIVTGDPVPYAEYVHTKAVFNFNSVMLARYISELNQNGSTDFNICSAINVNAHNFRHELKKAQEKEAAGARVFFSQPVFSMTALENLRQARQTLSGKILGGIIPIVSERNARFMDNEVAGINIPEELISHYQNLSRREAEDLAVKISLETAAKMLAVTDGYYLITPFGRTELIERIVRGLRNLE